MTGASKFLLFLVDLLFLNLSVYFYFYWSKGDAIADSNRVYLIVFTNLAWLFLSMVANPYNLNKAWSLSKIVKAQAAFLFIHLLLVISLIFFYKKNYSFIHLGLMYILFITSSFFFKTIAFYMFGVFFKTAETVNYILLGNNDIARKIRKYYLLNPQFNYKFKGQFDLDISDTKFEDIRVFSAKHGVHVIYCCLPNITPETLDSLVRFGLNSLIKVKLILPTSQEQSSLNFDKYDYQPGISVSAVSIDEPRNQLIKRVFDLAFSLIFFILFLSWLIPLIALLIKLDSKGPVFFIQQRNGEGNKPFGCIKFRTMVANREADVKQATKNDPRITRIGAFLRKSSIDELPQFLNVIKGDMSLIGPRPHPIKLNERFAEVISHLMARHYVKPGITGLAQCMGYRGETQTVTDMENRVRLDRYYIENWSFWLDIKIILLTVVSLIRGSDKAY